MTITGAGSVDTLTRRSRSNPLTEPEMDSVATRDTPIRILHVIDSFGQGGAETSLAQMLPLLRDYGFEQTIACFYMREEGSGSDLLRQGFEINLIDTPGHLRRALHLRRLIRTHRPHLVHSTLFDSDIASRLASLGTGTQSLSSIVNTTYDPIRRSDPQVRQLRLAFSRVADALTAFLARTEFHAITHTVKRDACTQLWLSSNRVVVIYRGRDPNGLGICTPERRSRARQMLGIHHDAEVVINVARQEYQKGQQHLLEALPGLLAKRKDLVVLIAGREGAATAGLQAAHRRLQLGDRVRMLGYRKDIPELLAASDLFVFPSLYEGLGGALIEAMAVGLPIVASDLPVLREVLRPNRNAAMVPPQCPRSLANAIEWLLDNATARAAFSAASRRRFEGIFTLDHSVLRMATWYTSCLESTNEVNLPAA